MSPGVALARTDYKPSGCLFPLRLHHLPSPFRRRSAGSRRHDPKDFDVVAVDHPPVPHPEPEYAVIAFQMSDVVRLRAAILRERGDPTPDQPALGAPGSVGDDEAHRGCIRPITAYSLMWLRATTTVKARKREPPSPSRTMASMTSCPPIAAAAERARSNLARQLYGFFRPVLAVRTAATPSRRWSPPAPPRPGWRWRSPGRWPGDRHPRLGGRRRRRRS